MKKYLSKPAILTTLTLIILITSGCPELGGELEKDRLQGRWKALEENKDIWGYTTANEYAYYDFEPDAGTSLAGNYEGDYRIYADTTVWTSSTNIWGQTTYSTYTELKEYGTFEVDYLDSVITFKSEYRRGVSDQTVTKSADYTFSSDDRMTLKSASQNYWGNTATTTSLEKISSYNF